MVYRLWYERAQHDHLIAPFDIALVGVELTPEEKYQYDELSEQISKLYRSLQGYFAEGQAMGADFMATVASWASEEVMSARTFLAKKFMRAVSARQRLLAQTRVKTSALQQLEPVLRAAQSTLIFTLTQAGAQTAADQLALRGIGATAVFSEMNSIERKQKMAEFRSGAMPVLAAPRVLDEGVDVPEADLGIVLAANRSKRQLVQRLGRVIRRKADGRAGKFVFLYAIGTIEDPDISGDVHLNEVLPHARELGWFTLPDDIADLLAFMQNPAVVGEVPMPVAGRHEKRMPESGAPNKHRAGGSKPFDEIVAGLGRAASPTPSGNEHEPIDPQLDREVGPEAWDGEIPELLSGVALLGKDSTAQYLKEIGRFPLLTAQEEVSLGQAIEAGLFAHQKMNSGEQLRRRERRELRQVVSEGRKAHQQFVCANLRLVVSIAKKYSQSAGTLDLLDLLDLIQEGNIGLERALQKWDFKKGLKFSTYASWLVKQAITRALADSSRTIRFPVHKVEEIANIRKQIRDFDTILTRDQVLSAIAEEQQTSVKSLSAMLSSDTEPKSLDRPSWLIEPGRIELSIFGDRIIDELQEGVDANLIIQMRSSEIDRLLSLLTEREELVMRLRYGLEILTEKGLEVRSRTLDEIGEILNVTQGRIQQIERKARDQLKTCVRRGGEKAREALTL